MTTHRGRACAAVSCLLVAACSGAGRNYTLAAQSTETFPRTWDDTDAAASGPVASQRPVRSSDTEPRQPVPPDAAVSATVNQLSAPAVSVANPSFSADSPAAQELVRGAPQPTAYAVVVGIERYPSLPAPTGARSDAERFLAVVQRSLGVPPTQVRVLLDGEATRGRLERELAWLKGNVQNGGRIYFFFSGHGAPDTGTSDAYLVPVDGDPQYLEQTAVSLQQVLSELGESQAKDVVAFVDTCFSGAGGRSVLAPGTRPILRTKEVAVPPSVWLLSASDAGEISGASEDGTGGAFSRYLVNGLGRGTADADGDGQVSLRELTDYVSPRVARDAGRQNRTQKPRLKPEGGDTDPSSTIILWGLPSR